MTALFGGLQEGALGSSLRNQATHACLLKLEGSAGGIHGPCRPQEGPEVRHFFVEPCVIACPPVAEELRGVPLRAPLEGSVTTQSVCSVRKPPGRATGGQGEGLPFLVLFEGSAPRWPGAEEGMSTRGRAVADTVS